MDHFCNKIREAKLQKPVRLNQIHKENLETQVSPPIIWVGGWDSGEEREAKAALSGLQYAFTSKEKRNFSLQTCLTFKCKNN